MFTRMFGQVTLEKYCTVAVMELKKPVQKGLLDQSLQQSRNIMSTFLKYL